MISNAKDTALAANSGTLPDMNDAIRSWFQQMVFSRVLKTIVNFQVVETKTDTAFMGVWQPYSPKQIQQLPEGQRAWSWFMVHADPSLLLQPDELITYLGVQYRVKSNTDYTQYGYIEYHLIEDYTGSGPNP